MSISTYAQLTAAIGNWTNRASVLSGVMDDLITLAESDHIFLDLRVREMEALETALIGTTSRFLSLPTGYLEMRRFNYTDAAGYLYKPDGITPDQMDSRRSVNNGLPGFYAVTAGMIEFERVPSQQLTAEMLYYKRPTGISSSNTTNDILTIYPDIYLKACIAQAWEYLKAPDKATAKWGEYAALVNEANLKAKKGRQTGAGMARSAGIKSIAGA